MKLENKRNKMMSRLLKKDVSSVNAIKKLYPRGNHEELLWSLWKKRIISVGILFGAGAVLIVYCARDKPESSLLKKDRYIERDETDSSMEMIVTGNNGVDSWEKKMKIDVNKKQFTSEEKRELEKKTETFLKKSLPGENSSLEHITKPLCFSNQVPETEIALTWNFEETYIKVSGELRKNKIPKEGVNTDIMVEASCRNWTKTYHYPVHLDFVERSGREQQIYEAGQAVKNTLKENKTKKVVELPQKVGNTILTYSKAEDSSRLYPVGLFFVLIFLLPLLWRRQQKKQLEARDNQMMSDHPEILNKVMLLLSAGLTFRGTVERLVSEYENSLREGGKKRYVYEELCIMVREIRDGVSEVVAVERFGKRCRLLPYLKFSSVITQNLRKGSEGLIDILEQESKEALEQRKERALRQGETAGTKLLIPMILMLGLVMGIIMIPAFLSL